MRERVQRLARHRLGLPLLALFTLVEAVVFPAPTEALLAALVMGEPGRAWRVWAVATAGSAAGGVAGYLVGGALYDPLVLPLLRWYGAEGAFATVGALYADNLLPTLLLSGYTPIPYLVYSLGAGAWEVPLGAFAAYAALGRGLKYALLTLLAAAAGPAIAAALRRYGARAALALCLLAAAAWLLLR